MNYELILYYLLLLITYELIMCYLFISYLLIKYELEITYLLLFIVIKCL